MPPSYIKIRRTKAGQAPDKSRTTTGHTAPFNGLPEPKPQGLGMVSFSISICRCCKLLHFVNKLLQASERSQNCCRLFTNCCNLLQSVGNLLQNRKKDAGGGSLRTEKAPGPLYGIARRCAVFLAAKKTKPHSGKLKKIHGGKRRGQCRVPSQQ